MSGYLFVHFTGEHANGEQIYFSISKDGMFWDDLNHGKPILYSNTGEKGVRDPFIVHDPKKEKYYLIATDLRISAGKGWDAAQLNGSRNLIVWESKDLVNWSEERSCQVGVEGAGCVWAPEAIYDEEKEIFFVFFASRIQLAEDKEPKHRIYGTYTKDFIDFTEQFIYIERETHVIDTTIVYSDGVYYRFSKDETNSKILLEKGKSLTGTFTKVESEILEALEGVEGPECFVLPNEKTWCLLLDRFKEQKGYMLLVTDNLESGIFRILKDKQYNLGE